MVEVATTAASNSFAIAAAANLAMIDSAGAEQIPVPYILLASDEEPTEAVQEFQSRLKVPNHVETFSDQSHGWMAARGDLNHATEHHYISSNHWAAILDSITDLNNHFNREEQLHQATGLDHIDMVAAEAGSVDSRATARSLLLYGAHKPASRVEILAALPPKKRRRSSHLTLFQLSGMDVM